jgi:flagellar motor protein MotB
MDTGEMGLSVNRAKTIYNYLIENGIDPRRLEYEGLGGSRKLVDEISDETRAMNRRVEIVIMDK